MGHRWRPPAGDDGFSLLELMVGAGIMSIVTAIAASGFVRMYHTVDKTDAAAQAQTALLAAFNKLDHEVRYGMRVSNEGSTATLWSVTYVIPDGADNKTCVQLTLPKAGGALLRRQWTRPDVQVTPAAAFTTVATDLLPKNPGSTPFLLVAGGTTSTKPFDTLELQVTSTVGVGTHAASKSYDLTFTALNTASTSINLKCLP
jgi:prepilin-type N-terminal cleavage/methylation domain-containing protein